MSISEPPPSSPPRGYGLGALVLAFLFGVGLMALFYGTGLLDQGRKVLLSSSSETGLVPIEAFRFEERKKIRAVAAKVASESKKPLWQVTVAELQNRPEIKELGLEGAMSAVEVQAALAPAAADAVRPPNLEGYSPVNFEDAKNPVLEYSIIEQPGSFGNRDLNIQSPIVKSFGEAYRGKSFYVFRLEVKRKPQSNPNGPTIPAGDSQRVTFGPIEREKLEQQIAMVKAQVEIKMLPIGAKGATQVPARFYSNREGKLALVIEGKVDHVTRIVNPGPPSFYTIPAVQLQQYMREREKDPSKPLPPAESAVMAVKN